MIPKMAFATVALATLLAPSVSPAQGKTVTSRNGRCQITVPATWTVGTLGDATSPDKKVAAIVSAPNMFDSFAELKTTAPTVYTESKVTKDQPTEFEMEGQSMSHKPDVYRAIAVGPTTFCIVEVIYESGTPDESRTIARTLKSGK